MADVFDESFEDFLREQAEERRRHLLELTEELGLRRLGYVPESELAPADRGMTGLSLGMLSTN
jgi:hypothetical protein